MTACCAGGPAYRQRRAPRVPERFLEPISNVPNVRTDEKRRCRSEVNGVLARSQPGRVLRIPAFRRGQLERVLFGPGFPCFGLDDDHDAPAIVTNTEHLAEAPAPQVNVAE